MKAAAIVLLSLALFSLVIPFGWRYHEHYVRPQAQLYCESPSIPFAMTRNAIPVYGFTPELRGGYCAVNPHD